MITQCKGLNCTSTDGSNHSRECYAEHEATLNDAARADHVLHGGWKCVFCGQDGQDNKRGNQFCAYCHRHN